MYIMAVLFYLLVCYFIGLMGQDRKFGFCGYFFASVFLTPLMGLLLVLASDKKKKSNA